MQVKILNQNHKFDNTLESIPLIIAEIQQVTESAQMVLSHFIIDDGQEIYEDFDVYLKENIQDIKQLEIVLIGVEQMFFKMIKSASDYLERALPQIQTLADEFYQTPTENTWTRFVQLLDGMSWLTECMELFNQRSREVIQIGEFKEKLDELENAVKNSDLILIGDLITYEVLPILEAFSKTVYSSLAERNDAIDAH